MAREEERPVQQSIIDRLIDSDSASAGNYLTQAQSVRQLRAEVRRDLEWLLNTRSIAVRPPSEGFEQVKDSVYLFGLEDITSLSADDPKARARLRSMIEQSIAAFEPRLSSVQVQELSGGSRDARQIRFTIHAILRMDPNPERVTFDTVFDVSSGEYSVKGDSSA